QICDQKFRAACYCFFNVIAVGDSNHEFEANEIPISIPHCMFHVIVSREPKE
ncbi:15562_t:CDS:1, partial [Gigaspora rosea]